jgi:transposase-like protein
METTTPKSEGPMPEGAGDRPKRRKREQWSEAKARRVLAELRASGEPIAHFARKLGVYPSLLHRWMNRLEERAKKEAPLPPPFIPVTVVQAAEPARDAREPARERAVARGKLTVEVCGHLVHVERGFDPDLLRAVVTALQAREPRPC